METMIRHLYRPRPVARRITSRLLSKGAPSLGFSPGQLVHLGQQGPGESMLSFTKSLLRGFGFASPHEAWEAIRDTLPQAPCLIVEVPPEDIPEPPISLSEFLRNALILGRCGSHLYHPDRPLLWTARRLDRRIRLVEFNPSHYANINHE